MTNHLTRTAIMVIVVVAGVPAQGALPSGSALTGTIRTHVVVRGDSLVGLGSRAGVDPRTLAADNAVDLDSPLVAGRSLRIDNRHLVPSSSDAATVVVNVPQRMLFHHDLETTGLPVAVGSRPWATPIGSFTVVTRETDPTWDVPVSILQEARRQGRSLPRAVPPGPANPLGRHWLGLSRGSIGLHGTNAPTSIYRAATHGCVRLHPDDIAWLYPRVPLGALVMIIYEPVLLADVRGRIFLEVHPDVYRRGSPAIERIRAHAVAVGLDHRIDWVAAERVAANRHGVARDVTAPGKDHP